MVALFMTAARDRAAVTGCDPDRPTAADGAWALEFLNTFYVGICYAGRRPAPAGGVVAR
jgi:hypothetical protein